MAVRSGKVSGENHSGSHDDAAYPPIDDYAVVGDCRTIALISRSGSCDWLCLPHFSSSSVFAAILDRENGGHFRIRPTHTATVSRRYLPETNILCTRFETPDGIIEVTDFMPLYPRERPDRYMQPQREFLRIVEGIRGVVDVEVDYAPRPGYAKSPVPVHRRGKLGWVCQHRDGLYLLHTDVDLENNGPNTVDGKFRIGEGEKRHFSFVFAERDVGVIAPLGADTQKRLHTTARWWSDWSGQCRYQGPYRDAVVRSALTLKLLTYSLSGAVIAAATTSLPESIGGRRNWDYRYCWLRDASLTLLAFVDLGYESEGTAFLGWLLHATRLTSPELQVLYSVYGEAHVREHELHHLEGYRGSAQAWSQLQLDVYGEFALAAYDYVQRGGRLDRFEREILVGLGHVVCRRWKEPDQGIWEFRGSTRHNTHSKLMCWVTLDRLLSLDEQNHISVPRTLFSETRNAIRDTIETRGFSKELDCYVGTLNGDYVDASLLLIARYGFISPENPRMLSTFREIEKRLDKNGLLHRYPPEIDSEFGTEATFGVCSFWAVDYLSECGELDRATERFEHLLSLSNDVGLYAEEIDADTGAALGNFPQAFTHVGLITAALSLEAATHESRRQTG